MGFLELVRQVIDMFPDIIKGRGDCPAKGFLIEYILFRDAVGFQIVQQLAGGGKLSAQFFPCPYISCGNRHSFPQDRAVKIAVLVDFAQFVYVHGLASSAVQIFRHAENVRWRKGCAADDH